MQRPALASPASALPASGAVALAGRIEADILLGELPGGLWLRLVDMEQRYGANSFEVRAALARLATLRLLEHVANRGYRVPVVTEAQVGERVAVRLLLEVPATALLSGRAGPDALRRLRELAQCFSAAVEHGTIGDIDRSNHDFHRAVWRLCGNPTLESTINELRERMAPAGWQHWKTASRSRASAREHLAFVDLLETADLAGLRRLTWQHITLSSPAAPDAAHLAAALGLDA